MQSVYKLFTLLFITLLSCSTLQAEVLIDTTTIVAPIESKETAPTPDNKFNLKIGGVVRFSYNYSDWREGQEKRGGDIVYDVFGLSANGSYNKLFMSAEYRFYSDYFGGAFIKHGYFGYNFTDQDNLQVGLTQVPFGITKYNSNSFFFSLACYAGFEDDYDMGVKYTHVDDTWEYSLAFFKNAEDDASGSDASYKRYAYDVTSIDYGYDGTINYRNKEINQFNGQVFYNLNSSTTHHRIGGSAQYGGIYNLDTKDVGSHYAYALHYELTVNRFNLKAQAMSYTYDAASPELEDESIIAIGAYGSPYVMASEAQIYTLGLSYTFPVEWGPITSLKVYNDYGFMDKKSTSTMKFHDTSQNVTGIAISAGPIYSYIDYAMGKNHSWLGEQWTDALATGKADAEWEKRFNINIGYYF